MGKKRRGLKSRGKPEKMLHGFPSLISRGRKPTAIVEAKGEFMGQPRFKLRW